jgi:hypothetical protein
MITDELIKDPEADYWTREKMQPLIMAIASPIKHYLDYQGLRRHILGGTNESLYDY